MRNGTRKARKLCRHCQDHRSVFCIHGHYKCDADHDLCPRCYRALRDSVRVRPHILAAASLRLAA